jgi:predicted chitinase
MLKTIASVSILFATSHLFQKALALPLGAPPKSSAAPTYEQFCAAVDAYSLTSAGGHPPKPSLDMYNNFVKYAVPEIPERIGLAMFLANCVWETAGLQFMKEIACSNGSCSYGKYYGRGPLQLTHDYNYREAAQALKDSSIFDNPDKVATPEVGWPTSVWFWKKNVAPVLQQNSAIDSYKFGFSIKVINGALECPANDKAQNRLKIFNKVLEVWDIAKNSPGKMDGC